MRKKKSSSFLSGIIRQVTLINNKSSPVPSSVRGSVASLWSCWPLNPTLWGCHTSRISSFIFSQRHPDDKKCIRIIVSQCYLSLFSMRRNRVGGITATIRVPVGYSTLHWTLQAPTTPMSSPPHPVLDNTGCWCPKQYLVQKDTQTKIKWCSGRSILFDHHDHLPHALSLSLPPSLHPFDSAIFSSDYKLLTPPE